MEKILTYHSGAYGDDKSRNGYGHLFFQDKKHKLLQWCVRCLHSGSVKIIIIMRVVTIV